MVRVGRQFALGALDVDVDPLVVARRVGKPIDLLLRDLHPVAHADLAANGRLEIVEIVENAHLSLLHRGRTRERVRVIDPGSGGAYRDVGARSVLERRELAAARLARRNLPAAVPGEPFRPIGPPGALMICCAAQPGLRVGRQRLVGPIAILVGGRRIDHAGDMAGSAEHETNRARDQARPRIGRPPGRDVVLPGRQEIRSAPRSCADRSAHWRA